VLFCLLFNCANAHNPQYIAIIQPLSWNFACKDLLQLIIIANKVIFSSEWKILNRRNHSCYVTKATELQDTAFILIRATTNLLLHKTLFKKRLKILHNKRWSVYIHYYTIFEKLQALLFAHRLHQRQMLLVTKFWDVSCICFTKFYFEEFLAHLKRCKSTFVTHH